MILEKYHRLPGKPLIVPEGLPRDLLISSATIEEILKEVPLLDTVLAPVLYNLGADKVIFDLVCSEVAKGDTLTGKAWKVLEQPRDNSTDSIRPMVLVWQQGPGRFETMGSDVSIAPSNNMEALSDTMVAAAESVSCVHEEGVWMTGQLCAPCRSHGAEEDGLLVTLYGRLV